MRYADSSFRSLHLPAPPPPRSVTVILVARNPNQREVIDREHFIIVPFRTANDAIDLLRGHNVVDVIYTDGWTVGSTWGDCQYFAQHMAAVIGAKNGFSKVS